jgi:hypothetical protein
MFFREKKSGKRSYLQVVENKREGNKTKQRVIVTLGRLDELEEAGKLDSLLCSGSRFSRSLLAISAYRRGDTPAIKARKIGPSLVFERLWRECGCKEVIESLVSSRKFGFDVERAVFLTVLHRLFSSGSDRAAEKWREDYLIEGADELKLHQLYRAMEWLGEDGGTSGVYTKDLVEEGLFDRRKDLFTSLELVFLDTTSIYFEGDGGDNLGEYGNSKDHRSDRRQMVVGAVLDDNGRPVCCEILPGNTADVTLLMPVVDRLRSRFGITKVCIVADRGMISSDTMQKLDELGWQYIFGVPMRKYKEIREDVLTRGGRYKDVWTGVEKLLKVKEIKVHDRRYVLCRNEEQARKDAIDRETMVEALKIRLEKDEKSLIGNKGYRKLLKAVGHGFRIDFEKIKREAKYDGKFVLTTNTKFNADEVALKYKQLWRVEELFRKTKSILHTRPIYHRCDETIRGHVFCSFLALNLMKELQDRLLAKGHQHEWNDLSKDIDNLQEIEIEHEGKRFLLRTEAKGLCGKAFQAAGVAMPQTVRQISS